MSEHQTRTYRGSSLEELLPRIREELGEQAVVTRQRDGVVGGVAGFFGKRCVEVDAMPGDAPPPERPDSRSAATTLDPPRGAAPTPALSAHSIVDLYDDSDAPTQPAWYTPPAPDPFVGGLDQPAWISNPERPDNGQFVETLFEQSSPFASHLASAEEIATAPVVSSDRIPEQLVARVAMGDSGLPTALADSLLREVTTHVEPFAASTSLIELLRRAIASELRVRRGWWGPRRTVAVIGMPATGKTPTVARLCRAYANDTKLSVSALSLQSTRQAFKLARLTEGSEVNFATAETPAEVRGARRKLEREELVVVDTPAFDPEDDQSMTRLTCLLDALAPDETHLLVPATGDERETKRLLESVSAKTDCLVLSHADEATEPPGAVVGLGITTGTPFSYVSSGGDPERTLEPADPTTLARMVLP